MAECPRCKAEYIEGDRFCIACGASLAEVVRTGAVMLSFDELAVIAGSSDYSALSPLAPHYDGPREAASSAVLDQSLRDLLLNPARALYVMEVTGDGFSQDVLLVRDGSRCEWHEDARGVTIVREISPRDFIGRITQKISRLSGVSRASSRDLSIAGEHLRALFAIAVLCRNLASIDRAAAFVTLEQLGAFLEGAENVAEDVARLREKGLIRTIDGDGPLIFLERKGEDLFLAFNEYEVCLIVQSLAAGTAEYASFSLLARDGSLFLVTNPRGTAEIIVREIDGAAAGSLIGWSWMAPVTPEP